MEFFYTLAYCTMDVAVVGCHVVSIHSNLAKVKTPCRKRKRSQVKMR
jgi:hypothetical protein